LRIFTIVIIATALSGSDRLADLLDDLPILGGIFGEDTTASSSAKLPPEPVDLDEFRDLIRDGTLSSAPCLWFAVLPDEQR
jgi:hypothetical protein